MFAVEVYAAVRRYVHLDGNSQRDAARVFGLSRDTISKMCRFSIPPGYTRSKPVAKPKLGTLLPVIDAILEADRTAPVKQRHTAKRIFERLRDEHGYGGGLTVVKDHVRIARGRLRETFVPLSHPPGHAQVDTRVKPECMLRRGDRGDRRGPPEDPLLLYGCAAVGRAVREGLSTGDDRGVPRRTRVRLRLLRRCAAVDTLR